VAFASTTQLSNLIVPAYDRLVSFELRETPTFRSIVDRRPVNVTNPGDTVHFTWYADLATTTTPLTETTTPDSLTIANPTRTSVTINEYGTWVPKTIKLQKTAFTKPDMEIAELLARQQGDTLDALVRAKLDAGTNTLDLTAETTKTLSAAHVRLIRNTMRSDNVPFRDGANYVAHVHPDVTFDLMSESGDNVWASPHTYGGDTGAIYAGEVGRYSAVRFIENTRCAVTAPGSGTAGEYLTYVVGKQALVEATAIEPHTVIGPVTDALKRHFPVGWYGLLGWSLFRPESLLVVTSQSSLAPALP
jgi:N4-gp56 family major capsid protein